MGVPPTLDHLIPVLPCHRLREGLRKVTWGERKEKRHTAAANSGIKHQTLTALWPNDQVYESI